MLRILTALAVIFCGVDGSPWEGPWPFQASQPASRVATTVQVSPPTPVVAAITPLCHFDAPNALEVSSAIEAFLPADSWYRMCRVAWCESRFQPDATNGPHVGVWQINARLWGHLGFDLRDIDQSTQAAAVILDAQGYRAWTCAGWN